MSLLSQIFDHGSFYYSLLAQKITFSDLYIYLSKEPVSIKTMIAYRSICQLLQTNPMTDDIRIAAKLFILETSSFEYFSIYLYSCLSLDNLTKDESYQLIQKQQNILPQLLKSSSLNQNIHFLCNTGLSFGPIDSTAVTLDCIFGCYSDNYIQQLGLNPDQIVEYALKYDHLQIFDKYDFSKYSRHLIARCQLLQKTAPTYWQDIAVPIYTTFLNQHLSKLPWSSIKEYQPYFPQLLSNLLANGIESLILSNYSIPIQAYYLGFPIHLYEPSLTELQDRRQALSNRTEFLAQRRLDVDRFLDHQHQTIITNGIQVNTANIYGDDINSFNPFDIIIYTQNKHITYFTRPEFDFILSENKNPWTNLSLPPIILFEISKRLEFASLFHLPPSKPLDLLLDDLSLDTTPSPSTTSSASSISPFFYYPLTRTLIALIDSVESSS